MFCAVFERLVYQGGQAVKLTRSTDDIDGIVFQEFVAEPLRHAADDGHHKSRIRFAGVLEMAEVRKYPLFGVLPHRAGVYQNYIRVGERVGLVEAVLFQCRSYQSRIELVHLATKGFYQYFFVHNIS
jgi:hypothetical protein